VEAADLCPVTQVIAIGVGAARMRAHAQLAPVAQMVAVRITPGGRDGRRQVVVSFPAIGQSVVIAIARGCGRRGRDVREHDHR